MTHAELDINDAVLRKAQLAAREERLSLSEYVEAALLEKLCQGTPRSELYEERVEAIEQSISAAVARWQERHGLR